MDFRKIVAAAAMAACLSWPAAAETYREDAGWRVDLDRSVPKCTAVQKSRGTGGLVLSRTPQGLLFSILDAKLGWLADGQAYRAAVIVDRSRWEGSMRASRSGNKGAVHVDSPTGGFINALERGSRLYVEIDGTRYGPYSLSGSRRAISDTAECLASSAAPPPKAPATAGRSAALGLGEMAAWSFKAHAGTSFKGEGVEVRIDDAGKNAEGDRLVRVTTSRKGGEGTSFVVKGVEEYLEGQLGLMRLDRSDENGLHLVFTSFWGGAHCCHVLHVVDLSRAEIPEAIEVGSYDGGGPEVQDIDGDGFHEIFVTDDRFRDFDYYARTFPPERVFEMDGGKIADVSRDPRFASRHEARYLRQVGACGEVARAAPGPCAGLAGTAATLGVLPETLAMMDFETAPGEGEDMAPYRVCKDADCRDFDDLKPALLHALSAWGYAPDADDDSDFASVARKMTGRKFGDVDNPDSEISCQNGPYEVVEKEGAFGRPVFVVSAYEHMCSFSNGTVTGPDAFVSRTVCNGEALTWLSRNSYTLSGDALHVAILDGDGAGSSWTVKACPSSARQ